jgi:hypothetical protein
MTTWVIITEHPPQLCQTSSKTCAALYGEFGRRFADTDALPGFKLVADLLITSDHRGFLIAEADNYEAVRRFAVESGFIQWNSVTTIPVINYQQALAELDVVKPIWP